MNQQNFFSNLLKAIFASIAALILSLTAPVICSSQTGSTAKSPNDRKAIGGKSVQKPAQKIFRAISPKSKSGRTRSAAATRSLLFFEPSMSDARNFAPIIYHQKNEVNWPVNVDWFMKHTSLWFYKKGRCEPVLLMTGSEGSVPGKTPKSPTRLEWYMTTVGERWIYIAECGAGGFDSDMFNSADRNKETTYYLRTYGAAGRGGIGPENGGKAQWRTYVHKYENSDGGATIQYWRVYSYQDFLPDFGGKHGGDWEGIQVVLDSSRAPREVRMLGHGGLDLEYPEIKIVVRQGAWDPNGKWGSLQWQDGHPLILSQRGGHASKEFTGNPQDYVEQRTWLPSDGGLEEIGSFTYPMARWVQYSGLWGSPSSVNDDPDSAKGGWWGPAFNGNKEMQKNIDGIQGMYLTAWCGGMNAQEETPLECFLNKPVLE